MRPSALRSVTVVTLPCDLARERLRAVVGSGVLGQAAGAVVLEAVGAVERVGELAQQAAGVILHRDLVAGGVDDLAQVAVGDRERRLVAVGADDLRRHAAGALEARHAPVAVGDRRQAAGAVVAKRQDGRLGQRVDGAQVAPGGVEDVQRAAVERGDRELAEVQAGQRRRDLAHAVGAAVEHVDRVVGAERERLREIDLRARRGAAVAARAGRAGAGDGQDPALGRDLAQLRVARVGDHHAAVAERSDRGRGVEAGGGGHRAVAAVAAAGDRLDPPVGVDPPHAVVLAVGDEDRAVARDHDVARVVQPRAGGDPAVAGEAGRAGAGQRGDRAVGADPAHGMVAAIDDIDRAAAVHRDVGRLVQERVARGAAVAVVAGVVGA